LRRWLDDADVPSDQADDVVIVASELVTNGVLHAGSDVITLRAAGRDGDVSLEVITVSGEARQSAVSSDGLAESGRGLSIVAGLARDVRVLADHTGWVVQCCVPRSPRRASVAR
jgi:anti-sigma regulatory factor (Ser/Thr protein kinase)